MVTQPNEKEIDAVGVASYDVSCSAELIKIGVRFGVDFHFNLARLCKLLAVFIDRDEEFVSVYG